MGQAELVPRGSTARAILLAPAADDGLRFAEMAERCRKAPSTITIHTWLAP